MFGKRVVDDGRSKHLAMFCSDGSVLLAFTGLASLYPGQLPMVDWVRETLRGENRTVEANLLLLTDRASRDISGTRWGRVPLAFHAVAFRGTDALRRNVPAVQGAPYFYEITNGYVYDPVAGALSTRDRFTITAEQVCRPTWFASGSGATIARSHRLLQRSLDCHPNRIDDYHGLLTKVNRDVSALEPSVSPWSETTFMPPEGAPMIANLHRRDDESYRPPRASPTLLYGFDVTDIQTLYLRQLDPATRLDQTGLERKVSKAGEIGIHPRH